MGRKPKQPIKRILHTGTDDIIENIFIDTNIDTATILLDSIEFAVENDLNETVLFELCYSTDGKTIADDVPVLFSCTKDMWLGGLQYLNDIFLANEQYEACGKISNLLLKLSD